MKILFHKKKMAVKVLLSKIHCFSMILLVYISINRSETEICSLEKELFICLF